MLFPLRMLRCCWLRSGESLQHRQTHGQRGVSCVLEEPRGDECYSYSSYCVNIIVTDPDVCYQSYADPNTIRARFLVTVSSSHVHRGIISGFVEINS